MPQWLSKESFYFVLDRSEAGDFTDCEEGPPTEFHVLQWCSRAHTLIGELIRSGHREKEALEEMFYRFGSFIAHRNQMREFLDGSLVRTPKTRR